MRRYLLLTLILALFSGAGCTKELKPKAEEAALQGEQPQVISTFTLVGNTPTGRKKWEIQGETADLTAELVVLSPVTAKSFGQVDVLLTANRGWFHRDNRNVELEGDVVMTTSDAARLMTDTFQWKAQRETGRTSDWVAVTRPGMTVLGKGGKTFPNLKRVRLEKDVSVAVMGKAGATLITCDGPMEVDYGKRKARFWRNVRVRDGKGFLRSDRMDVVFHPKRNDVVEVQCWGHVEIFDREKKRSAFSHRAHSWRDIGRTLLIGHPKLALVAEHD